MKYIVYTIFIFCLCVHSGICYEYTWEIAETPEGQESITVVEPVQVVILGEAVTLSDYSASIKLRDRYSVHLGTEWSNGHAARLLQTFETIPQTTNGRYSKIQYVPTSLWHISNRHIHNDIEIEYKDDTRIVRIAADAFTYANPLLAEIEGVRGRYYSKRLHRAVVRYVSDDGNNRQALSKILKDRYAVSVNVIDYEDLTRKTTAEGAGRFSEFKNNELISIVSMFEEYPSGMLKTPGLNYLVRRLDGTPHPLYPNAAAVAWTSAGYIEFMDGAFKSGDIEYTHRLILHEKAHFLWDHLFDEQLKNDWIELGGWYENPDDPDGWSTTKQHEFVSAYAHGVNPNEDMAESISFYIVTPDKLRSRSPAKYEFIQDRIMHGTRYISQIREDLTFEVYNLYPDYVYPGKIIRVDINVDGLPDQDKQITVEIEIHSEDQWDTARSAYVRVFSEKGTYFDIQLSPINANLNNAGSILRGTRTLSKYAAMGYWAPNSITLKDRHGNERHGSQSDFGWKLYIYNPLSDCDAPQYVPNSMKLELSDEITKEGRPYQILIASWEIVEQTGVKNVTINMNDEVNETYSLFAYGRYDAQRSLAIAKLLIADYSPNGMYLVNKIGMTDVAGNKGTVYFTDDRGDEDPAQIEIETVNPDISPPVLDVNEITITAKPTRPESPDGETIVDVSFYIKDDISGYVIGYLYLREPQGVIHRYAHYGGRYNFTGEHGLYFTGDPTVYKKYQNRIVLPVGSAPGTWGLAQMKIEDKAGNTERYDFTEIVRFDITDMETTNKADLNSDGEVNILDLVLVSNAIGKNDAKADVNGDGVVNILDLVEVANQI